VNSRDAASGRRTTIPYREDSSHSAMSESSFFLYQLFVMFVDERNSRI
tara:strand:- start:1156 stop:1299 length:144 start_codon:yes stop_codon:yes gene_type:complete